MSNIEALERLVGAEILQVKLYYDPSDPFEAYITTTDGKVIKIAINSEGSLYVEMTDVS